MRVVHVFARLTRVPGEHIASCANRPFCIEDRNERFVILKVDRLFEIFGDAADVKRDDVTRLSEVESGAPGMVGAPNWGHP